MSAGAADDAPDAPDEAPDAAAAALSDAGSPSSDPQAVRARTPASTTAVTAPGPRLSPDLSPVRPKAMSLKSLQSRRSCNGTLQNDIPVRGYIDGDRDPLSRLDSVSVQLNREVILDAAFDILDAYGLGDLSMRRLARNLDVAPGALYWHFSGKQALLGAVADRILEGPSGSTADVGESGVRDAGPEAGSPDWRARTLAEVDHLVHRLLSTRDGAEIVAASLATGALGVDPVEQVSAALRGAPARDVGLAAWVTVRYLLGAVTELQTARSAGAESDGAGDGSVTRILAGAGLILDGVAAPSGSPGQGPSEHGISGPDTAAPPASRGSQPNHQEADHQEAEGSQS